MTLTSMRPSVLALVVLVAVVIQGCSVLRPEQSASRDDAYTTAMRQGMQLTFDRQLAAAVEQFSYASRLAPQAPAPHFQQGESLFRMDRFQEALEAYERALALDRNYHPALRRSWATRLELEGRRGEIRRVLLQEIDTAVSGDPDNPELLLAAGEGYGYLGQSAKRAELLSRLVEVAKDREMKEETAALLQEQIILARDDPKRRLQLAQQYIRYFRDFPGIGIAVNAFFYTLRQTSATARYPERLAELSSHASSNPVFNRTVAQWLLTEKQYVPRAVALLQHNLQLAESSLAQVQPPVPAQDQADDLYLLAVAHYQTGALEKAKTRLREALRLNPEDSYSYRYLALIARDQNNPRQAIAFFREALELGPPSEQVEQELRILMKKALDSAQDPHRYFANQTGTVTFTDVTVSAGLAQVKASRIAWGDYDNDGRYDLLLNGRLFRNTGKGFFKDVTTTTGLKMTSAKVNGGAWGDYDNDGFLDLLLTSHGVNYLLRNAAGRSFIDVTATALPERRQAPTESVAWGDMDNDGFVDLYIANYERSGVERAMGVHDRLLRNRGDGRFEDISRAAGIVTDEAMCGRGVTWGDFDGDGRQDILVSNYRLDPNFLWRNRGNNRFSDVSREKNVRGKNNEGYFGHAIGSVFGDLDNDGDLDIFVSNLAHPRHLAFSDLSMVLLNTGKPLHNFQNVYPGSGLRFEETSSDPSLADVDNDGDLDLYITSIYPGRYSRLYLNDGAGHFKDVSWLSGTRVENGWGNAFADYDGDGDPDLLVASENGVRLLRNDGSGNHWLNVAVNSSRCNRFGIGSKVRITDGRFQQLREITAGKGTGTQEPPVAHFGLGSYDGRVEVTVTTLCGDTLRRTVGRPDRTVVIRDGW